MPFIYILKCIDGTLYTGSCIDVDKRLKQHNGLLKGGAKYTSGRRPVQLLYTEEFETLSQAQKREYQIKKLSRSEKEKLLYKNAS